MPELQNVFQDNFWNGSHSILPILPINGRLEMTCFKEGVCRCIIDFRDIEGSMLAPVTGEPHTRLEDDHLGSDHSIDIKQGRTARIKTGACQARPATTDSPCIVTRYSKWVEGTSAGWEGLLMIPACHGWLHWMDRSSYNGKPKGRRQQSC
jgi:hypothetical protein